MPQRTETPEQAYERGIREAAQVAADFCYRRSRIGGFLNGPAVFTSHTHERIVEAIHGICLDDKNGNNASEGGTRVSCPDTGQDLGPSD